jgi:hypothetical protein
VVDAGARGPFTPEETRLILNHALHRSSIGTSPDESHPARWSEDTLLTSPAASGDPACHESDATLQLEQLVRNRLRGQLQEFYMTESTAGLVLHGRTGSYYCKQLAQHTVMKSTTLLILGNEIEVIYGRE